MTPSEFITALAPAAQATQAATGIPASAILGQAAWESGWGSSGLALDARNLFGVKAGATWTGPTVTFMTKEYLNKAWVNVPAVWRSYDSWQSCMDDHTRLFTSLSRYAPAVSCHDGEGFIRLIAAAGYATDPNYAANIIGLMRQHNLEELDKVAPPKVQPTMLASAPVPASPPPTPIKERRATSMRPSSVVTGGVTVTAATMVPLVTWALNGFPHPVPEGVPYLIAALLITVGHAAYNLVRSHMTINAS